MAAIDLGAGSGSLACLAAQRGAGVYAIEHANIMERARQLAASNRLDHIQRRFFSYIGKQPLGLAWALLIVDCVPYQPITGSETMEFLESPGRCSACAAELPRDAEGGLCPKCLLGLGLSEQLG